MSQLTFQFPFKKTYYEKDFYVSSNNFQTYKLIESWPNWPSKVINIFGPSGCGKTHLSNIIKKKIHSIILNEVDLKKIDLASLKSYKCIVIDDFQNKTNEEFLYTFLNFTNQFNIHVLVNSKLSIKKFNVSLRDLKSRFERINETYLSRSRRQYIFRLWKD